VRSFRVVALAAVCLLGQIGSPASGTATAEPAPPPLVVVLVQGLNSASDDQARLFRHLWPAISRLRPDARRLDFSYRGGAFDADGAWSPEPYASCDTYQSILVSASALGELVSQARARWEGARIAVVGHSLGGVVALTWLAEAVGGDPSGGNLPDVVVTLDSPLRGISERHAAIGWIAGQTDGCPVLDALPQLVGLYKDGGSGVVGDAVSRATERRSHVVMVADLADIAFACCVGARVVGPSIETSQYLDVAGGDVWSYTRIVPDLPGLDPERPFSHHAALFNRRVTERLAGAIAGLPDGEAGEAGEAVEAGEAGVGEEVTEPPATPPTPLGPRSG
jgi:hypothetical protein